ncbi:iron ABC transporter permease [Ornithinimicrobium sp. Arc0846-15]|nr:iron ABC transporter permease [Ornithinimicrobium laminariae]
MTQQRDLDQAATKATSPVGSGSLALPELSATGSFRLRKRVVAICVTVLIAVILLSAASGAAGLPVAGVARSMLNLIPGVDLATSLDSRAEAVLFQIRLPRTILGVLVGAALGMAGASFQGVFRNPLADPYLLGVSAGAGFGAVLALGFGLDVGWGPVSAVPAAAFIGAVVAVMASVLVARGSWTSPATLLLSGVAVAALFSAAQTYALQKLDETRAREVLSWLFGRLATSGWEQVLLLLPYVIVCGGLLIMLRRHLDVMRLGDDEARALGLNPARSRFLIITAATLLTAAAVAVSGLIAFVGLVVPHLVRLLTSHSYRVIVPLSALVGGSFMALVDIGARTVVAPAELPVGIITAFVGAPFFALVLRRSRRGA